MSTLRPQRDVAASSVTRESEMIGTTRLRVNTFMNKFRHPGFINYNAAASLIFGGLAVYSMSRKDRAGWV